MKNKILVICILLTVFITVLFPIIAFADDNADTQIINGTIEEWTNSDMFEKLWLRAYEYWCDNNSKIISAVASGVMLMLTFFVKRSNDKKNSDLQAILGDTSITVKSQKDVIKAVSIMINGYNEMCEAYKKYQNVEDDRNRLVAAVMIQNTAITEILHAVYINNRNLPQSTKDFINQKVANCMKELANDAALSAVVEEYREKINALSVNESSEVQADDDNEKFS